MRVGAVAMRPEAQEGASRAATLGTLLALGLWGLTRPRTIVHQRASMALLSAASLALLTGLFCRVCNRRPINTIAETRTLAHALEGGTGTVTCPDWGQPVEIDRLIAAQDAVKQAALLPAAERYMLQHELTQLEYEFQAKAEEVTQQFNAIDGDLASHVRCRDLTNEKARRHMDPATASQAALCHSEWCRTVDSWTALRTQLSENMSALKAIGFPRHI
jgi:hypothetical protein